MEAGDLATRTLAHGEATEFYRTALELMDLSNADETRKSDAREKLADSYYRASDYRSAMQTFQFLLKSIQTRNPAAGPSADPLSAAEPRHRSPGAKSRAPARDRAAAARSSTTARIQHCLLEYPTACLVDGPNACRSARRMRFSIAAATSKRWAGSLGAMMWLTSATAIRPASSPTLSSRYS